MIATSSAAGGIRFRWLEQGDGTPVILIHGIPTGPALWRHVIPRISGARCLAWEMVGYGKSIPEGRNREISVGRQADYLVSWLRHIGLDRVILAGHDLGGGVAQIAAVRNPRLCVGLFLTNAIGYDSWPIPSVKIMRSFGLVVRQQVFRSFLRRGHTHSAQALGPLCGARWRGRVCPPSKLLRRSRHVSGRG
jgi:pimeloyl-ACP methyl ester carboxylesterase